MGKGTITANLGLGQYTITYNFDSAKIEARIASLTAQIARINTVELPVYQAAFDVSEGSLSTLLAELNALLATDYDMTEANRLTLDINTARTYRDADKSALNNKKLEAISVQKDIDYLQANKPVDYSGNAWCADLNINLSGTIGTIEVPGERAEPIIIRPGGITGSGAVYAGATDGIMTSALALHESVVVYNLAMLPGWQKWQPTYRLGTITAIDIDTCEVTLDEALSGQQNLDVNAQNILEYVAIEYMACNGGAFQVGDRVVVKFTHTGPGQLDYTPKVIGFESNPKVCEFRFKLTRGDGSTINPTLVGSYLGTFTLIVEGSAGTQLFSGWYRDNVGYTAKNLITDVVYAGGFYYDSGTDEWALKMPPDYVPPVGNTGFFAFFDAYQTRTIRPTQYPYRYHYDIGWRQPADMIMPRKYVDIIPYWYWTAEWHPSYVGATSNEIEVFSSVPYVVTAGISGAVHRYILWPPVPDTELFIVAGVTVTTVDGGVMVFPAALQDDYITPVIPPSSVKPGSVGGATHTMSWVDDGIPSELIPPGWVHDVRMSYAGGSIGPEYDY